MLFLSIVNVQIIAFAIVVGVVLHAGVHLACDFLRLVKSSPGKFALIASDFKHKKPTYGGLLTGIEGITGIGMVILMAISFTLATSRFRRNAVKLPAPFNRLAGYNGFWYSHHLLGLVYVLLLLHGIFLFLVHKWTQKTVRNMRQHKFSVQQENLCPTRRKYQVSYMTFPMVSDMDVHICPTPALLS